MSQSLFDCRHYVYRDQRPVHPLDATMAVCRWCGQAWKARHRLAYSDCCYAPRLKAGEVAFARKPRHPFERPMKHDLFSRSGRRLEVRLVDAGGVMSTEGEYRTWAQWRLWAATAKVVRRGDA